MLSHKDMSKVSATVCTFDFRSHTIRVKFPYDSAWNLIVKTWPATVCFKLVFGTVKFCAAAFADIGAFVPKRIVFACEGHLRAFVNYYLFFFRGKFFQVRFILRRRQQKTPRKLLVWNVKKHWYFQKVPICYLVVDRKQISGLMPVSQSLYSKKQI